MRVEHALEQRAARGKVEADLLQLLEQRAHRLAVEVVEGVPLRGGAARDVVHISDDPRRKVDLDVSRRVGGVGAGTAERESREQIRMRAGGAGIPGFYTKTGVGTVVAEGKELKEFDGETYVLERGIVADLSIVKGWKADETGNLMFRKTARNFNQPAATCAKVCVAEVEEIVAVGSLDPDCIHLPSIYVKRLLSGSPYEKQIEFRTTREREAA